jgi:cytochrome b6-f complex iron-sulfur subunit
MENSGKSRRHFFATVAAGIAGLLLANRYLSPRFRKKAKTLTLAKADIPEQGALVYREARIAVIREKGELYALDLVCTHLGCTLSVTPAELVCPCHGSRFDRRGVVLKGPADRPLKRYGVHVGSDGIIVSLS